MRKFRFLPHQDIKTASEIGYHGIIKTERIADEEFISQSEAKVPVYDATGH